MNRIHRLPLSLPRIFKSSKLANNDDSNDTENDELDAMEKSFRRSSFQTALLPSIVTPSRVPSNTAIASSRGLFSQEPTYFHIPYGRDKWPEIVNWYRTHINKDSTSISKIQLRKDHEQPYAHEFIVIFTTSGHKYRVDRRPDAETPFDTIMKEGCTAHDTIERVLSSSSEELEETSNSVVELHWQDDRHTVDLLFILYLCFRIHNDQSAKRYTLQHYNCYFLSWTMIIIIVRNSTAWETELNSATLESHIWPKCLENWSVELGVKQDTGRCLEQEQQLEKQVEQLRELELELEQLWVKKPTPDGQKWAPKPAMELEEKIDPAREQEVKLEEALGNDLQVLERVEARQQQLKLTGESDDERAWKHEQTQVRKRVLERAQVRRRERMREREIEQRLKELVNRERVLSLSLHWYSQIDRSTMPEQDTGFEFEVERTRVREWLWQLVSQLKETVVGEVQIEDVTERVRVPVPVKYRVRVRELEQEVKEERKREQKRAQVLVRAMVKVPLVLGWHLAQGWKKNNEMVRERLLALLQEADTAPLPGELWGKTLPGRQG